MDFAEVYHSSLPEQLATYLSIPFETISEYVPTWCLTTDVTPLEKHAETLPFLAYDLSQIRAVPLRSSKQSISKPRMFEDFYRTGFTREENREFENANFLRGASGQTDAEKIVRPDPAKTSEHAWVGDGFPLGANKLTVETLKRRFDYSARSNSGIDICVVCNDNDMSNEIVEELYDFRGLMECDVSIYFSQTTSNLREILKTSADLFHYIGHVDEAGFRCTDGYLDARTLDTVAVKAFFLNACSSYEQGMSLIEEGSIGGIVTLADVANKTATRVGRTFAGLLNSGFPLRTALSIARKETVSGYRYITVGNGDCSLVQSDGGFPSWTSITTKDDDRYAVRIDTYLNARCRFGATYSVNVLGGRLRRIVLNDVCFDDVRSEELSNYLRLEKQAAHIDGQLRWHPAEFVG